MNEKCGEFKVYNHDLQSSMKAFIRYRERSPLLPELSVTDN